MLSATRPHGPGAGPLRDDTLGDRLRSACATSPATVAVVEGPTVLDYARFGHLVRRAATAFRDLGLGPGDVMLTQLPNWWEAAVAAWAGFALGAVVVPVVPIYRSHELAPILDEMRPRLVVAPAEYRGHAHAAELRDLAGPSARVVSVRGAVPGCLDLDALTTAPVPCEVDPALPSGSAGPDDVALVLYTSGTTARPKGVLHTHRTLLHEARDVAGWCRLTSADRVFMGSPLSHITGLTYGLVLPVDLAGGVVLQPRWDADAAVGLVADHGCTFTVSATPFLRGLADAHETRGPSTLRVFVCGGADVQPDLVRRAHEVMGTRVVRTYGSTELPTSAMADPFGDPDDLDAAADGDGVGMGGNELRLGPDDELEVRGPELFVGYADPALNDDAFTPDGWFRTGDRARIDADGTLHIVGRLKDVINRGGEKFSVADVESVLLRHPGVSDVAVVGYPDPVLVERACAVVVPRHGWVPSVDELRDFLVAQGVAIQKAPERVQAVAELPRTASGKIQRFVLRDRIAGDGAHAAIQSGVERP